MKLLDKIFGKEFPRSYESVSIKDGQVFFVGLRNGGTKFGSMDMVYGDLYIDTVSKKYERKQDDDHPGKTRLVDAGKRYNILHLRDVFLTGHDFQEGLTRIVDCAPLLKVDDVVHMLTEVRDLYLKDVEGSK